MTQDELIALLNAHEWRDVEFKEAQRDVPRNAYETVSAFSNTEGGHLVFGVRKSGQDFEVVGVLDVDKVQNDFLSALRQRDKISIVVNVREELHKYGDADLLIFYVPEAHRSEKPIFLNGNINRAFVRRGGCDVLCSDNERNRFLIDAATERYDSQPVDFDLDTAFDLESIKWYRTIYEGRSDNRSYTTYSDADFLNEIGLLVEQQGQKSPSRAAIFLFGSNATFRQLLPRPTVDCQRFSLTHDKADIGERWIDRLVLDENLIRVWQSLVDWYQRVSDHPFRVDPSSLQRDDTPPDYRAFRESMVNLLIHQDYSDHTRKPEIRHYTDQTVFWNPGDAFAAGVDLLEPGEKEVRNPRIVTAFRRIGLSENAGWGLRDVYKNWQQLGNVPPQINNNKNRKSFELILRKEELLSEQQLLFQASLGVHLSNEQARVFAYVCREKKISLSELKAITELSGPEAIALADSLVTQMLLAPIEGKEYSLTDHLKPRFKDASHKAKTPDTQPDIPSPLPSHTSEEQKTSDNLVSAQDARPIDNLVTSELTKLGDKEYRLVDLCEVPRMLTDIMAHLGFKNKTYFKRKYVNQLIDRGVLRMTKPEKPRAKDQKYVVTDVGLRIVKIWRDRQSSLT